MTAPTEPAQQSAEAPAAGAAEAANQAGAAGKPAGNINGSTHISSLEELRKVAPDLYQKVLEGMAQDMCRKMKAHDERLKELMRKAREGR